MISLVKSFREVTEILRLPSDFGPKAEVEWLMAILIQRISTIFYVSLSCQFLCTLQAPGCVSHQLTHVESLATLSLPLLTHLRADCDFWSLKDLNRTQQKEQAIMQEETISKPWAEDTFAMCLSLRCVCGGGCSDVPIGGKSGPNSPLPMSHPWPRTPRTPLLAPQIGDTSWEHVLLPPSRAAHRWCWDQHPLTTAHNISQAIPVDLGHLLSICSPSDLSSPEEALEPGWY